MCLLAAAFIPVSTGSYVPRPPWGWREVTACRDTSSEGGEGLTPVMRGVTSYHHKFEAPRPFLTCALVFHVDLGGTYL